MNHAIEQIIFVAKIRVDHAYVPSSSTIIVSRGNTELAMLAFLMDLTSAFISSSCSRLLSLERLKLLAFCPVLFILATVIDTN